MLLGRALLAVGQLVAGRGQRDLGVVLHGDVLEGAAERDQRVARQHRLGEDPQLPDHRGAGPHDAEHRHGGLPPLQQLLLEPADGRAVGGDHEAVQRGMGIGDAWAGSSPKRANASRVQRTVPAANCSSQPPRLPSRCACSSTSATCSASPGTRQVNSTPAKKGTACRSASTAMVPAVGQRRGDQPGRVLGVPAAEHPQGPREQAVAGRRPGIGLEQGQRGDLRGRAPGRVGVPGAQVHDGEVGDLTAGVAQRPDDQRGVGDLGQRREDRGGRRHRPDRAGAEADAEHVGEPGDDGGQPIPGVSVELPPGRPPPGFGDAEQGARPVPQAEHRAGRAVPPGRRDGDLVTRRRPGLPPQVRSGGRHPLLRAVQLRRQPPPAAGVGAAEAVGAEQLERAVGLEQPDRDRRHPEPRRQLPGERADQLDAVPGPDGRRQASGSSAASSRSPATARRRRPGGPRSAVGWPRVRAGEDSGSWRSTAAAISVTGMPAAAAISASCRAAVVADSPSRSISTPRGHRGDIGGLRVRARQGQLAPLALYYCGKPRQTLHGIHVGLVRLAVLG